MKRPTGLASDETGEFEAPDFFFAFDTDAAEKRFV